MLYGEQPEDYRKIILTAWQKHKSSELLEPMEKNIVQIILQHPELMNEFDHPNEMLKKQFDEHNNPFLHIGQHILILEMLSLNNPPGIIDVYQKLMKNLGGAHEAEHFLAQEIAQEMQAAMMERRDLDFAKVITRIVT